MMIRSLSKGVRYEMAAHVLAVSSGSQGVTLLCESVGPPTRMDRRKTDRLWLSVPARWQDLSLNASDAVDVVTVDMNSDGLRMLSPLDAKAGTWLRVQVLLVERSDPLVWNARVVWRRPVGPGKWAVGMQYLPMPGSIREQLLDGLCRKLLLYEARIR